MEKRVKRTTRCWDRLIEIAGDRFLGVPSERCHLALGQKVKVLEGPIEVPVSGRPSLIVKTRHLNEQGQSHEGWCLLDDLDDPSV